MVDLYKQHFVNGKCPNKKWYQNKKKNEVPKIFAIDPILKSIQLHL